MYSACISTELPGVLLDSAVIHCFRFSASLQSNNTTLTIVLQIQAQKLTGCTRKLWMSISVQIVADNPKLSASAIRAFD